MRRRVLFVVFSTAVAFSSIVMLPKTAAAEEAETPGTVELVDEGSETTRVFQHADGTRTMELYGGPVRVNEDGAWKDVDLNLAENSDGTYSPRWRLLTSR